MSDLSENDVLSEVSAVSNTDTQEQSDIETVSESDAEIDAINEALAEAEDLENNTHDSEKDALSDGENDDISENNTHEVSEENETGTVAENETTELSGNSEQLEPSEPVGNNDRLEELSEPEPQPNPWDDAPADCYFYEKTYEDGHLGSYTESAETAYKFGWDIEHNYILIADTEKSDVNGFTYPKELCPHKSERDKQIELWNREIFELKEELNATDYKAIKYAEGVLTDEDYQPTGIQRQAWRKRINELERLIAG